MRRRHRDRRGGWWRPTTSRALGDAGNKKRTMAAESQGRRVLFSGLKPAVALLGAFAGAGYQDLAVALGGVGLEGLEELADDLVDVLDRLLERRLVDL